MGRFRAAGLAVLVLTLAVGCGGDDTIRSGSVPDGASFAPADTAAYVVAVTDVDSEQWQTADDLLKRFPGRAKLLESFTEELEEDNLTWEEDVRPALGDDVHVVWLDFANDGENAVGYTKPKDEAKFNKLLECCGERMAHREIDGWTVFSDTEAKLERFVARARADDSLADDDVFRGAMERLPDDALSRAYVSGQQIEAAIEREAAKDADLRAFRQLQKSLGTIESLSFAATAREEGVRMDAVFAGSEDPQVESFGSALAERLPAGALAYVSFGDLRDVFRGFLDSAKEGVPNFEQQRRQLETALGFSLEEDLFPLFSEEGAIALYQASEINPGVTIMLDVEGEEDKARNVINRLGALLQLAGGEGTVRKLTIDGVEVTNLRVRHVDQAFEVFVGISDGVLIVSSTEAGFRDALSVDEALSDDEQFDQAKEAAELPDENLGYVYLDLNQALEFILDLSALGAGDSVDPEVRANLEPLESVLFYGTRDGNRVLLSGFLTIK
jgi:Protein of unknown function (DUF3352)